VAEMVPYPAAGKLLQPTTDTVMVGRRGFYYAGSLAQLPGTQTRHTCQTCQCHCLVFTNCGRHCFFVDYFGLSAVVSTRRIWDV